MILTELTTLNQHIKKWKFVFGALEQGNECTRYLDRRGHA